MKKRKITPKKAVKKAEGKARRVVKNSVRKRSNQSITLSFIVGALTVFLIGFLIFQYAQNNNYKNILGETTQQNLK